MSNIQTTTGSSETKAQNESPKDTFQFQCQSAVLPQPATYSLQNPQTLIPSRVPNYHDAELKYAPIFSEALSLVTRKASSAQAQISRLLTAQSELQTLASNHTKAIKLLEKCLSLANQANNGALSAANRAFIQNEFSILRDHIYSLLGTIDPSCLGQSLAPVKMTFELSPETTITLSLITANHLLQDFAGLSLLTPSETIITHTTIESAHKWLQAQLNDIQTQITKVSLHLTEQQRLFNPAQRLYEILSQYS